MTNLLQAPKLYYSQEAKMKGKDKGFTMRSIALEDKIMQESNNVGEVKLMFFLTANAGDGSFGVAEKTVLDRCGMSESTYKRAKKALIEKGWITAVSGKSITVNIEKIMGCQVDTSSKTMGCQNDTLLKNIGCQNDTSMKTMGCQVATPSRYQVATSSGCQVETHNNISKKDKEKDNSSAPGLAADAANPSQSSPDVKQISHAQAKRAQGNTFTVDENILYDFSGETM